jgi:hypothetical protein
VVSGPLAVCGVKASKVNPMLRVELLLYDDLYSTPVGIEIIYNF